ncbi:hypothetical protein [[Eubacterium] cellulosolvens]
MTSESKVEANRKNALKSTGPKDTSITRFNAIKHGLTAEKLVIMRYENKEDYESIIDGLCIDFQPQTTVEHLLIEQIATCLWRRIRIIRSEKAEIEEQLLKAPVEFSNREASLRERSLLSATRIAGLSDEAPLGQLDKTRKTRKELFIEKHLRPCTNPLLIRYDSTLERQFYRALILLMKFQEARRRGIGFVSQKMEKSP